MKRWISADALRLAIPALSLTVLLAAVFWLQPRAMSYVGLNLLFNLAVPIALATIAQMLIMSVNDLNLSMGTFVSFVACVTATFLRDAPLVGVLILAGLLESERGAVVDAAASVGLALDGEGREGEWWAGAFRLQPG